MDGLKGALSYMDRECPASAPLRDRVNVMKGFEDRHDVIRAIKGNDDVSHNTLQAVQRLHRDIRPVVERFTPMWCDGGCCGGWSMVVNFLPRLHEVLSKSHEMGRTMPEIKQGFDEENKAADASERLEALSRGASKNKKKKKKRKRELEDLAAEEFAAELNTAASAYASLASYIDQSLSPSSPREEVPNFDYSSSDDDSSGDDDSFVRQVGGQDADI